MPMFVIGVTGGIGSGKSSFSRLLAEAGLPVLDADETSKMLTAPGGSSMPAIVSLFGHEILDENGGLNRSKMSSLAFQDKKCLDQLSAILHQDIAKAFKEKLQLLRTQKCKAAVLDVPLPVKEGFLDLTDLVVCVWADTDKRLDRLEKRGLPREEALRRMAVQLDRESYLALSDILIENNGTEEDLRENARCFLEKELNARGIPYTPLPSASSKAAQF